MPEQPETTPTTKPGLDSLTIQGLIVAALGVVARWVGAELDEAALGQIVGDLWTVGGLVLAVIGRTRATLPLAWRQPKAGQ